MNKQYSQILADIEDFSTPQLFGLSALIMVARREKTSIGYQHKKMGFSDIPRLLVTSIDQLSDDEQLEIVAEIVNAYVPQEAFISVG